MQLPLDQIQGNITPGFRKDHQALLFLRFGDQEAGRRWVKSILPYIASAEEVAHFNQLFRLVRRRVRGQELSLIRSTWVNVAFSSHGLRALSRDVSGFSKAFTKGPIERIKDLEDHGNPTAVAAWKVGKNDATEADAMLIVGSDTRDDLEDELVRQGGFAAGLTKLILYRGQTLGDGTEHFGFRDGVSQPDPADPLRGWEWDDSGQVAAPGEFVLGLPDARGSREFQGPRWAELGSFVVFRRLAQDVQQFWSTMREAAEQLRKDPALAWVTDEVAAAKVIGRWPSGTRLTSRDGPWGEHDPVQIGDAKPWMTALSWVDFEADPLGDGCPLFGHIRKAHPRRAKDAQRHRIVRRGIPYLDGEEHGLLFLAYQARIEDGFEFIQRDWLNRNFLADGEQFGEFDRDECARPGGKRPAFCRPGPDPVAGIPYQTKEIETNFHRPGRGACDFVAMPLQTFVTVMGSGYFFAPSLRALGMLAGEHGER